MEDFFLSAGVKLGAAALKSFTGKGSGAGKALSLVAGAFDEDGDCGDDDGDDGGDDGGDEEAAAEEYAIEEEAYAEEEYYEEEAYEEEEYYDDSSNYIGQDAGDGYYEEPTTYDAYDDDGESNSYYDQDGGSGYDYTQQDAQYQEPTTYGQYEEPQEPEEHAGHGGHGGHGKHNGASHRGLGTALAVGGAAVAGAALVGGAALAAKKARGRGGAAARGRGASAGAIYGAPLRGAHPPQPQRGRGGPALRGRPHSQSFGTVGAGAGCPPPLMHSATAPAGVHYAVRGAPSRGRGAPRGRGRGGGGVVVAAVPQQAYAPVATRGRGAVRARGAIRLPGAGRGVASLTSPGVHHAHNMPGNIPPTLGPAPCAPQFQQQAFSGGPGVSVQNASYIGQAPVDPNATIGAPPPYNSVVNTAFAPTQRVQADPKQLEQMSKRKLAALQAVQRREKSRIEAKRREEQQDQDRLQGLQNGSKYPDAQELEEPKVQINLPPGVKLQNQPEAQEMPNNQADTNSPSSIDSKKNNRLSRTSSVFAPQVVDSTTQAGFNQPPARQPQTNFYEMDGAGGFSKPNPQFNSPVPLSYPQSPPARTSFSGQNHQPPSHRWSVVSLPSDAVEIGGAQQPPHPNSWGQPQSSAQSANQPQRSSSLVQRFPSRKPVQRPVSMMIPPSHAQNMANIGFNQPAHPQQPIRHPNFQNTPPQQGYHQNPGVAPQNFTPQPTPTEIAEEEPDGWKPPPLKAVQRRKFNSGEPEPLVEEPTAYETEPLTQKQTKSHETSSTNSAFAPPPPPPSLPFGQPPPLPSFPAQESVAPLDIPPAPVPPIAPSGLSKQAAMPQQNLPPTPPEIPKGYFENVAPGVDVPGLTVRKGSLPASFHTQTANMAPAGTTTNMVAHQSPTSQFQNQQAGHHSTIANQAIHAPHLFHETSTPTVTKIHQSFPQTASQQQQQQQQYPMNYTQPPPQQLHHANTFPATPNTPQSASAYNQQTSYPQIPPLPQPPSHIMEMPGSTGFAYSNNTKSPYDMNPMIAELPELPLPPGMKQQGEDTEDLNRREGHSYDTPEKPEYKLSANAVSFGWDSYY
ncbi:hypothetical protein H072_437 [Dactylellina haptotyla CBS 200.50]|uniref:Uncharacterized protein n=1 Tax=Dactylellina haptotyla (strain CBS 200.50) TaxID=1284197 RepID=S8AX58_DACHA|nr:hypothetical protein H072_437 [Dactylellina haptotyla CBS 200.50]